MNAMKRKIAKKVSKEIKSLLIGLLIGDGTISSNYVFKMSHSGKQKEYLLWKINLLNQNKIKNNGLKEYYSKSGYNKGKMVLYNQLSIIPTIKALRRQIYKPKKSFNRKLLNWLDSRGIAIWYMDDGHININNSKQRGNSIQRTIKIATCVDFDTVNIIIEYFKEVWGINFRPFKEGKNTFSIATSAEIDTYNFIKIVKPYILEVPSLLYKIRKDFTKEQFIALQNTGSETRDIIY